MELVETTPDLTDLRIAQLERERYAPLTEGQRTNLPAKLRNLDEAIRALRAFPLSDGGSEPATRFNPLPMNAAVRDNASDFSAEEAPRD
jgi:hypothetical protein